MRGSVCTLKSDRDDLAECAMDVVKTSIHAKRQRVSHNHVIIPRQLPAKSVRLGTSLMADNTLAIKIEFGGGMELLFSNQRSHDVRLPAEKPSGEPADVEYLIQYMRDNMLKEREELFIEGDSVRPGILVLINDTDWELEGEGAYQLKSGDEIVFISTLHGG